MTEAGLVGRAEELAALGAVIAEARDGAAPVLVVHGEAGIGKTSLVADFADAARRRGVTLLWGTCHEGGGLPYGPWVEAIDRYIATLEPGCLAERLGADRAVLATIAPSIREAFPDLPPAPVVPSSQGQPRLFDAVARFLASLRGPMLVLDDLQWAEHASLDLLVHVARLVPGLLTLAICRGTRLDVTEPVAIALARIARTRPCNYLTLHGLRREHAAQLLEQAVGNEVNSQLIDEVHAETRGNPFFLRELGRHIHRLGRDAVPGTGGLRLPETILGAVALRLAALSDPTRRLLELAAVFSSGFAFEELQALAGLDDPALLDCLEEALTAELLEPTGADRYEFAHALVRHALLDRLNHSRRIRIHRELAEALSELHEHPSARLAAEIAHQYRESAGLPGAERGAPYALAAADHARSVHASVDAVNLLRSALQLVGGGHAELTAKVLSKLALAEAEAGMPAQATATLESAIAALESSGAGGRAMAVLTCDVATVMRSAIADLWNVAPLVARPLALLGDEHDLLWARLKMLDRFAEPIRSGPLRIVRFIAPEAEARRIVRAHGTAADIASTIDVAGPWCAGELEWATAEISGWSDTAARCTALFWVVGRLTLGDAGSAPELAERLCREFEALADRIGAPLYRTGAARHRAALLLAKGSLDAAAAQIARARALAERLPEPETHMPIVAALEAQIAQYHDREWWLAADQLWEAAQVSFPGYYSPMCAGLACYAFAVGGVQGKARELLGYLLPALVKAGPWDHMMSITVGGAAGAIWELRDEALAERLAPVAQALVDAGVPDWVTCSNYLSLARLSAVLGRVDDAIGAFGRAREKLERTQPPLRGIVDFDEVVAREWHGLGGADAFLFDAQARFQQLGMTAWCEKVASMPCRRERARNGLSPREAEVLQLLASGLTNRQIAERLVLSVHTVERHVNNLYMKIGAHNRADAAAYSARQRL